MKNYIASYNARLSQGGAAKELEPGCNYWVPTSRKLPGACHNLQGRGGEQFRQEALLLENK